MAERKLISFDWALKKILRDKSNFEILEGFLSELLNDDVKITEIMESEGNQEHKQDKFNRVDLKVNSEKNGIIIIELQYERELDFMQRLLYGVSKTIAEHSEKGAAYSSVVKVISISIMHFDIGAGRDYVYKGTTNFYGLNERDKLQLDESQKKFYKKKSISEIHPEYYLLMLKKFGDQVKNSLDEWIYFFKKEEIKDEFKAKGIKKAKENLDIMKLSDKERAEYSFFIEDLKYQASMYESSYGLGLFEGRDEGLKEGIEKGRDETILAIALSMKEKGVNIDTIAEACGLSAEQS